MKQQHTIWLLIVTARILKPGRNCGTSKASRYKCQFYCSFYNSSFDSSLSLSKPATSFSDYNDREAFRYRNCRSAASVPIYRWTAVIFCLLSHLLLIYYISVSTNFFRSTSSTCSIWFPLFCTTFFFAFYS